MMAVHCRDRVTGHETLLGTESPIPSCNLPLRRLDRVFAEFPIHQWVMTGGIGNAGESRVYNSVEELMPLYDHYRREQSIPRTKKTPCKRPR